MADAYKGVEIRRKSGSGYDTKLYVRTHISYVDGLLQNGLIDTSLIATANFKEEGSTGGIVSDGQAQSLYDLINKPNLATNQITNFTRNKTKFLTNYTIPVTLGDIINSALNKSDLYYATSLTDENLPTYNGALILLEIGGN